jgi:hypothetical protein
MRERARPPKVVTSPTATQATKKQAEIDQLRAFMKTSTLLQAVAQAAIEQRLATRRAERQLARVTRVLPSAAKQLRQRLSGGNLGLSDQRSILQGRAILFKENRRHTTIRSPSAP